MLLVVIRNKPETKKNTHLKHQLPTFTYEIVKICYKSTRRQLSRLLLTTYILSSTIILYYYPPSSIHSSFLLLYSLCINQTHPNPHLQRCFSSVNAAYPKTKKSLIVKTKGSPSLSSTLAHLQSGFLSSQYHQVGGVSLQPVLLHPTSARTKVPSLLGWRPQASITGLWGANTISLVVQALWSRTNPHSSFMP